MRFKRELFDNIKNVHRIVLVYMCSQSSIKVCQMSCSSLYLKLERDSAFINYRIHVILGIDRYHKSMCYILQITAVPDFALLQSQVILKLLGIKQISLEPICGNDCPPQCIIAWKCGKIVHLA